jgi:hypothetical protein
VSQLEDLAFIDPRPQVISIEYSQVTRKIHNGKKKLNFFVPDIHVYDNNFQTRHAALKSDLEEL